MNRALSIFPRFLSGLIELEDVNFTTRAYFSRDLIPFGDHNQSVGLIDKPFTSVFATSVYATTLFSRNGELQVNQVTSPEPLKTTLLNGIANVSLTHDGSLQVVDGALSVKPIIRMNSDYDLKFADPLKVQWDDQVDPEDLLGGTLRLDTDSDDFEVDEDTGKLKTRDLLLKGKGCLRVQSTTDADWLDSIFDDLGIDPFPKTKVLQLKASSFFTQNNGTLAVADKPGGQIPFYSTAGGLDSDDSLKFNGSSTLEVRFIKLDTSLQLPAEYATSKHYVSQYIQSEAGSAIDIEDEVQGANKRIVKLRYDKAFFDVSETNDLTFKQKYKFPLRLHTDTANSELECLYDDKSIKLDAENRLSFGLSGDGIRIDLNTSNISVNYDETLKIVNQQLSLNLSTTDPLSISGGKDLTLKFDAETMELTSSGQLRAKTVLVDNSTIGWSSDGKLTGLYRFQNGLTLSDGNLVQGVLETVEYPLSLDANRSLKLWHDDTLRTDAQGHLTVVPILTDNFTIVRRNDATFQDGALKVNLFGENGVSVVGNKIRGAYMAGTRISISGATISCSVDDLQDDIQQNADKLSDLAGDLASQLAGLSSGIAAASALAGSGVALANSAITASGVNSGLISGLTSGLAASDAAMSALGLQSSANTAAISALTASTQGEFASLASGIAANSTAISLNTSGLTGLSASTAAEFATVQTQLATLSTLSSTNTSLIGGLQTQAGLLEASLSTNIAATSANTGAISSLTGAVSAASGLASGAMGEATGAGAAAASAAGTAGSALALSTSNSASIALLMLGLFGSSGGDDGDVEDLRDWVESIQHTVDAVFVDHLVQGGTILTHEEASGLFYTMPQSDARFMSISPGAIEMGEALTSNADGNCIIDMHSSPGTDYDTRLYRLPGVNGTFNIYQNGTGPIQLSALGGLYLNGRIVQTDLSLSTALASYYTKSAVDALVTPLSITAGTGLLKSANTLSVNPVQSLNTLTVLGDLTVTGQGNFANNISIVPSAGGSWMYSGINPQLSGGAILFNMGANMSFFGPVNSNFNGGMMRLDTRPSLPLFQFINNAGSMLMSINNNADANLYGSLAVNGNLAVNGKIDCGNLWVNTSAEVQLARTGSTYLFIQSIPQNRVRIGGYDATINNYRPIQLEGSDISITSGSDTALTVSGGISAQKTISAGRYLMASNSADDWPSSTPKCLFMRYSTSSGQDSAYIQSVQHGVGYNKLTIDATMVDINCQSGGGSTLRMRIEPGAVSIVDPVYMYGGFSLNGSGRNNIGFNQEGIGPPTFNTRSPGTKLVLFPQITASSTEYALGIDGGTLWSSVPDIGQCFKWYFGQANLMQLNSDGFLATQFAVKCTGIANQSIRCSTSVQSGLVFMDSGVQISTACNIMGTAYSSDTIAINKTGSGNRYSLIEFWSDTVNTTRSGYIAHPPGSGPIGYHNVKALGISRTYEGTNVFGAASGGAHYFTGGDVVVDGALHVNGSYNMTLSNFNARYFDAGNGGSGVSSGTFDFGVVSKYAFITRASYWCLSDRRAKENIKSLPEGDATEVVSRIAAKSFIMKEGKRPCVGFIAQEVQAVLPEAVMEVEGSLSLDTTPLLGVLWQALKELANEVKELKKKVEQ
jgi:hypothetical protein